MRTWDPARLDPDAANRARALLMDYRRPNGEIVLRLEQADRLEMAIQDALHDMRGMPKP